MKGFGPVQLFVCTAIFFGGLFAVLVPPFQSPDEPNHFLRAYQLSEGHFFPEKIGGPRLGGDLPVSLQALADSFSYLKNNYAARLHPGLLPAAGKMPLQPERRRFLDFANTAVYAPLGYLPQAGAIAFLRPLGAGPLAMLYAARLSNLLIWILLVWAALSTLPVLHRPVAGLAMLPASLVIAASANADVVTNGLCCWLFAAFCQPGIRRQMWQVLAFTAVCAAKLVTLPLGLLYALQRKSRLFFATLLMAGVVAAIAWGQLAQRWFIPYAAYDPSYRDTQTLNEGVDPAGQLNFVANHPGYFLQAAAQSYVRALPSTLAHLVGKFGWEKNYLPAPWLAALWMAILGLLCCEAEGWKVRQRSLAALVAVLFIGFFSITMYMLWCPVGAQELTNLQGRYFVPIGPVAALVFSNRWLAGAVRLVVPVSFGLLVLGNTAMVWAMWMRWW